MNRYARIVDNVAVEIVMLPKNLEPTDIFSTKLLGDWKKVDDNVQQNWIYDGRTFKEPVSVEFDLEAIKNGLKKLIDANAEAERLKYITPGVGQSMTYQEKVNQAAAYSKAYAAYRADPKNLPEPTADGFLLLAASVGIDGDTLLEVAETVTYAYAMWQQIGAAIEEVRLKTKMAIEEAKTEKEAQAIFAAIKWPNTEKQENTALTT